MMSDRDATDERRAETVASCKHSHLLTSRAIDSEQIFTGVGFNPGLARAHLTGEAFQTRPALARFSEGTSAARSGVGLAPKLLNRARIPTRAQTRHARKPAKRVRAADRERERLDKEK